MLNLFCHLFRRFHKSAYAASRQVAKLVREGLWEWKSCDTLFSSISKATGQTKSCVSFLTT